MLSSRFVEAVRRRLPQAAVEVASLQALLDSGNLGALDAMVLPIDEAIFASRVQPSLAAVLPEDDQTRGVVAYAVPRGAAAWRAYLDTWIEFTRASGGFADARRYWVEGGRWTSASRWAWPDVLGLW